MNSESTESELDPLDKLPEGFITGAVLEQNQDRDGIRKKLKGKSKLLKSILKTPGKKNANNSVSFSTRTQRISIEYRTKKDRILSPVRNVLTSFAGRSENKINKDILRRRYSYSYSIAGNYKSNKLGFMFVCLSIGFLSLSSALFFVAFFTRSWGIIEGKEGVDGFTAELNENKKFKWYFGLWLCCRNDGRCLGLKWPAFYSIARLFAVVSLFGHILTLACLIGHTLEKLLKYDLCTMVVLISSTIITCISSMVTVIAFGLYWEKYFLATFPNITDIKKSYSYYLAIVTVPLTFMTSATLIIDLQSEWRLQEIRRKFGNK